MTENYIFFRHPVSSFSDEDATILIGEFYSVWILIRTVPEGNRIKIKTLEVYISHAPRV